MKTHLNRDNIVYPQRKTEGWYLNGYLIGSLFILLLLLLSMVKLQAQCSVGAISYTNVGCFGGNTGSVSVLGSGGTGPYSFEWNTGQSGSGIKGLVAGIYTVTMTDAVGCKSTSAIAITQPPALNVSGSSASTSCGSGSVGATVTGGTGGYTYFWSTGSTANTEQNLVAGTYTVTVTDANGCTSSSTATVTNQGGPVASVASATNAFCNGGNTGSAVVAVTGGTLPYVYKWAPAGGAGPTATGLVAGTYTINVTDANGCSSTSVVTINQPSAIALSTSGTSAACGSANGSASASASGGTPPLDYSWSNGVVNRTGGNNNLAPGSYTVTATDANGCAVSASETVSNSGGPVINSITPTSLACFGIPGGAATVNASGGSGALNYSWSTGSTASNLSGLSAGSYTVTVQDSKQCEAVSMVIITTPTELIASLSETNSICGQATGSASASVVGGTGTYTYLWSNGDASAQMGNLEAGSYTLTVTDANGCVLTKATTIACKSSNPCGLILATASTCSCTNGLALVAVAGGNAPYSYLWSNGSAKASADSLSDGNYTVTVTDAAACSASSKVDISCSGHMTLVHNSSGLQGTFNIYPNPSNSQATLEINLVAGGYGLIALYDMLGRKVADIYNGNLEEGNHNFLIDTRNFSTGMYLVRMDMNNDSKSSHLVVTK